MSHAGKPQPEEGFAHLGRSVSEKKKKEIRTLKCEGAAKGDGGVVRRALSELSHEN